MSGRDPLIVDGELVASVSFGPDGSATIEPVEPSVRFAIDADCPGCGYPERSFDPARGVFACSSLNPARCGYESTERDR